MIINGKKIDGQPKQVKVTVAGKELDLTMVFIGKDEKADAKFKWNEAPEGIVLESVKVGNRVATTISAIEKGKDGKPDTHKVVFEDLTAQSAFQVLNAKFGWTIGKADSVYKKSNPTRKESKAGAGASKVVITEAGTF
jgi:hypothetical protein